MKKFLALTVAAAALGATAASAADLPRRSAALAPAPVYAVPIFTWAGFYVGLNAGAGFQTRNNNGGTFALPAGSVVGSAGTNGVLGLGGNNSNNRTGFIGGGQIGYNWQFGNIVAGVETDLQYADMNRRSGQVYPAGSYTFTGTPGLAFSPPPATVAAGFSSRDNYFGTVRGRLGFAFDRALVYGTGGFAYSQRGTGYALGGGAEYAFTNNWSAKIEALYVSLNRNNNGGAAVFNAGTNTLFLPNTGVGNRRNEFVAVRVGLNYRFNWGGATGPVVASY